MCFLPGQRGTGSEADAAPCGSAAAADVKLSVWVSSKLMNDEADRLRTQLDLDKLHIPVIWVICIRIFT